MGSLVFGGEGGIRTHDRGDLYNGFRDRPVQPLRHLSNADSGVYYTKSSENEYHLEGFGGAATTIIGIMYLFYLNSVIILPMEDQAMSNRLFSKNFLWIVTLAGLFMQSWLPGLNLSPQAAQAAEPVAASTTLLEASSKWKLESLVVNGQEGWGLFSDSTPAVGPDGEVVFNAIRTEGSGIYSLAAAPFIPVALDRQLLPNGMGMSVSYTHLRAHETPEHLVCRLLLEKKKLYHLPLLPSHFQ